MLSLSPLTKATRSPPQGSSSGSPERAIPASITTKRAHEPECQVTGQGAGGSFVADANPLQVCTLRALSGRLNARPRSRTRERGRPRGPCVSTTRWQLGPLSSCDPPCNPTGLKRKLKLGVTEKPARGRARSGWAGFEPRSVWLPHACSHPLTGRQKHTGNSPVSNGSPSTEASPHSAL